MLLSENGTVRTNPNSVAPPSIAVTNCPSRFIQKWNPVFFHGWNRILSCNCHNLNALVLWRSNMCVMLAEPLRTKVWGIADSYYPKHDWAHGRNHIERVLKMAIEIGKQERADLEIVELATILHDIFQNREAHASIEGLRHENEATKEVRKILAKLGVADRMVDEVCHCIESHRKRSGRTEPQTIEAKCLFDADKLDCIGAIGTIRSAFVSFDHKQEFYKEVDDIEAYRRRKDRKSVV